MVKSYIPLMFLLAISVAAQEFNTAIGLGGTPSSITIFDEIEDAAERRAFREVWDASDPRRQRDFAIAFIERYPQSILLREAYELAARACVALGDLPAGIEWAKRSLRLMPENPFLLVMIADIAAKQSDHELAKTSARDALDYLANADTPTPISREQWPRVRNELRATAYFVLGRIATAEQQYKAAEQSLLTALSLQPDDMEAVYVLGVARMAMKDEDNAAPAFAHVAQSTGALAEAARQSLRTLYDRKFAPVRLPLDDARGLNASPSVDRPSFDAYVASLKWTPPEPARPAAHSQAPGRYAGSAACRDCHRRVYESWASTGMAKMFRPYGANDIVADFSGRQTVSGSARALLSGGKHFIEIREGETAANPANQKWIRYPVDYIIGSKWQQAYGTLLPDSRILVFPIQYSRRHSTWVNYWKIVDAPNSERADISRFHRAPEGAVYQNTCAACHTSQLKFETRGPFEPILLDRPKATFREGGINCEMCHGPSLDHVEAMRGPKVRLERDTAGFASETPIRFRQLPPAPYLKICAQCHAQSAVHDALPGGAVNYSEDSAPFYRAYAAHLPSNFSRKAFYRDGRYRATTFISEAFARSKCFRKGGATCGSCHDPHPPSATTNPTSLKFGEDSDEMCVQCHTTMRQQRERHTRHRTGTEGSRCVSCHMPRNMDALLFPARSHQIDEIPDAAMTARFGNALSPNACLGCHGDRHIAWLEYQLAKW